MKIGFNRKKENRHALLRCRTICQDDALTGPCLRPGSNDLRTYISC